MKKKVIGIVLSVLLVVGLAACGNSATTNGTGSAGSAADTSDTSAEDVSSTDVSSDGKTLVVYYSATGNTEAVANTIAEETGGDLFELEPVEPYTDEDLDWTNDDSRVSVEHEDENSREVELVSTSVENWETYDTVYIGYPIWWGIAAWPVDGFVKANDFEGKTVIPFATASSSGIGQSGELLQEMSGAGNWLDGECFHGSTSAEDIQDWIGTLGI